MTKEEWLACTDPKAMLDFLGDSASDGKLRLFAVACCRRIWPLVADTKSRQAVEISEQYADDRASDEELEAASKDAASVGIGFGIQFSAANAAHFASRPGRVAADRCAMYAARAVPDSDERVAQARLVRCLWGDPFRKPRAHTAFLPWNTSSAVNLAQSIYDARAFERLSELADELEKADCDDANVVGHCREAGPHARGCWVVDRILGKE
jgi:hypothetical protein